MRYNINGLSLKDFCNINKIDYKTILNRINRIKKKLINVKINDVIKISLNNDLYHKYFSDNNKYYYKGTKLTDYCKENNLNYNVITNRIRKLKKQYPQLIEERIIIIALDNNLYNEVKDKSSELKYFYKDDTLYGYCKKNALEYKKMLSRVRSLKNIFEECTIDEIVEIVIDDEIYKSLIRDIEIQNSNYDYYYKGYPLNDYCKMNDINPNNIYNRVNRLKNKYSNYTNDELLKIALNDKKFFSIFDKKNSNKFSYYKGITLRRYCKLNNVNYSTLFNTILKLNEQNNTLEEKEIIELALGLCIGDKKYNNTIKTKYQKELVILFKNILERNSKILTISNQKQICK